MSTPVLPHEALRARAQAFAQSFDLRDAFRTQPGRFETLSLHAPHVWADASKLHWDADVLTDLLRCVEQSGLESHRQAMWAGECINSTEHRPVLHAALRCGWTGQRLPGMPWPVPSDWLLGMEDMLQTAEALRARDDVDDVVHIGVGGSGLGPDMVLQALQPFKTCRQRLWVVTNLDGQNLHEALQGLDPARTAFVVVSKSWSTVETLRNAASAMAWSRAALGDEAPSRFIAISSKPDLARQAGMGQVIPMPEGIGGRFSVWSAVGLIVAVAMGSERFREFLAGAADMDAHFATAPLETNLPVWLGALDVWHSTYLQVASRALIPYSHGLRRLPAYLQQLEMESNGKRVQASGQPVMRETAACVWGEPGSDGQHAFFQWLHQGTQRCVVEFLVVARAHHSMPGHQTTLVANALAQAEALMQGGQAAPGEKPGHQDFPGNRPSLMLLLEALTPTSLGALMALYEHRVFVAGVLWGVNSFDQWGVELGKRMARKLEPLLTSESPDTALMQTIDPSTAGLIAWLRRHI
jgi:glucose-6-phosphate isomerase